MIFAEADQKETMDGERQFNIDDEHHDAVHPEVNVNKTKREVNRTMAGSGLEKPQDSQQSLALPSQLVHTSTMRRSVRERRFQGKYTGFKVTYSVLPQGFKSSQTNRGNGRRGSNLGSKGVSALPSHLKEVAVGMQHDTGYSDWERSVQGKLIPTINGSNHLSPDCFLQVTKDPVTVQEALGRADSDQWIEAMESEYDALRANETWNLEDLPKGRKPLKSKWVFKIKTNPDGTIERYKARLVIKGYSQVKGVDYSETYSPVVRYATIRHLLALAAQLNLIVYQMDAVTAFLQGDLDDEEIYMEQPEGFQDKDAPRKVCRLKKALYGLKQASRVWNIKLDRKL